MSKRTRQKRKLELVASSEDLIIDSSSLKEILDPSEIFSIYDFIVEQIDVIKEKFKQIKAEFKSLQDSQQYLSDDFYATKDTCTSVSRKKIYLKTLV